jgi:hypothetical protein
VEEKLPRPRLEVDTGAARLKHFGIAKAIP